MKLFISLILFLPLSALGQTAISGTIQLKLGTNWLMLPPRECTNFCCRDQWPATVQWEGTIFTNQIVTVTNSGDQYSIRIEELPRNTVYTKPKRTVAFNVAIENDPLIRISPTNKVAATIEE